MIDKLPKCLHTCFHCWHAIFLEEYSRYSRRIIFEGCWKDNSIRTPVDRENCDKFEESPERIKRRFWKKWIGYIYVADEGHPGNGKKLVNYEAFRNAEELLPAGKLPTIEELPTAEELQSAEDQQIEEEQIEEEQIEEEQIEEEQIEEEQIEEEQIEEEQIEEEQIEEEQIEEEQIEEEQTDNKNATPDTVDVWKKSPTTRSLILQALANNISRLKDIAHFAGVEPSTAHYHIRNLVREERVIKVTWGHYIFSDDNSLNNDGKFLETNGRIFEKLLKNFSQPGRVSTGSGGLHPSEKNILMDILSKENKYEQFSERELARRSNVSRYSVKKYTQNLEKKRLITIRRENNQFVYTPTELAIKGLTGFFQSVETGSKIVSESSKVQPVYRPMENSKIQPLESEDQLLEGTDDSEKPATSEDSIMETFDDYIAWQQKNAHRLIIQFKLIRCNHLRLKKTGWIFGEKSIHKHFTEAYIFKSKDPTGEFINVLPKHPFIFTSPFEFEDKIIAFVNEVIDRLRAYGITIDLSEPAEIKMEHAALEDNIFARKVIKKKVLYFKSKVQTVDSTGEVITYVIAIDKSKKLHLECEGTEAHHLMENCEEFIDDIATKRIDPKLLRRLPEELTKIKEGIEENKEKQIAFDENLKLFLDTIEFYSENIKTHINAMTSLTKSVDQLTEATEKIEKAAGAVEKTAEALIEVIGLLKKTFH